MDGWMDGWMHGCVDAWMHGLTNGWRALLVGACTCLHVFLQNQYLCVCVIVYVLVSFFI